MNSILLLSLLLFVVLSTVYERMSTKKYRPYTGPGPFKGKIEIHENTVVLKDEEREQVLHIREIQRIIAYKIDLYVYDEVMLDVETIQGEIYHFSEGQEAFSDLAFGVFTNLPGYSLNWYFEVTRSAFDENKIVVYNKKK